LLIGKQIKSIDDAWEATEHLHKKGCQTVVLSSTDLGDDEKLLALASSRIGKSVPIVSIIAMILYVCFPRKKKTK
jgi:pyridoxal/pyridoxine/pyridoxamine kinase